MEPLESEPNAPHFLEEIAQLAHSDLTEVEFYNEMSGRLAESTSAVWLTVRSTRSESFPAICSIGKATTSLGSACYQSVLMGQTVRLLLPHSDDGVASNPTDHLIAVGPVSDEDAAYAVVELGLADHSDAGRHSEIHELLTVVTDLAATYHRHQELSELRIDQGWWRQLDQFARDVHASMNPATLAYTIVNEGRRIIDCDRMTLLVAHGRRMRVAAVSGAEAVNRRANAVRQIEDFCEVWLPLKQPLNFPCDVDQFPDQVRRKLLDVVQESNARSLRLTPLFDQPNSTQAPESPQVIGGLIVETFAGDGPAQSRFDAIASHAERALRNVREHQSVFLLPLWSAIGKLSGIMRLRNLPKTMLAAIAAIGVGLTLTFVQSDFEIIAEGTLQPDNQRYIFAPHDGVVEELNVEAPGDFKVSAAEYMLDQL